MASIEDLACVKCLGTLEAAGGSLRCRSCATSFDVKDGIADFRARQEYFFNPVSAAQMAPLIREVAFGSWDHAIRGFVRDAKMNTGWLDNLVVDGRYAWKVLLDLRADSKVLDLGCGLGNLTHNIAPLVRRMYALDLTYSRLQFSRARFERFNPNNDIVTIAAGDQEHLPFRDGVLDCVIISGVLEWIGEGDTRSFEQGGKFERLLRMIGYQYGVRSPRRIQLRFLREVRRILKPSGQLFVAIENRLNHEYFTGRRDHHSMLFFGSLLPRTLANLYSIAVNRKPYRTYTYSLPGYRRLLRNAGFPHSEFLGLSRGYSVLEEIMPSEVDAPKWQPEPGATLKERIKRSKYLVPAYGIVSSATPTPWRRRQDAAFRAIESRLRERLGPGELVQHAYFISAKQKLIVDASYGSQRLIIRIPLNDAALEAERNNAYILEQLRATTVSRMLYPSLFASGEADGIWYSAEEKLAGQPLVEAFRGNGSASDHLPSIQQVLDELSASSTQGRRVRLEGDAYETHVRDWLPSMLSAVDDLCLRDEVKAFFEHHLYGRQTTTGITHGDLGARNVFVSAGRITGLIDWESGQMNGLPILDAINYLASVHLAFHPGASLANLIHQLAAGRSPVLRANEFLANRFDALGMDRATRVGWVYLAWLHGISQRLSNTLRFDPTAIDKDVVGVIKMMLAETAA